MTQGNRQYLWAAIMIVVAAMTVLPYRAQAQDGGSGGPLLPPLALPDLVIASVTVTNSANLGDQIPISDVTSNQSGYTRGSFYDYIYLCTSSNDLTSSCLLESHLIPTLMGPGATYSWSGTITIPQGTALGTNFVCDVADGSGIIKESNPNNNTNSVMIIINQ